MGKLARKFTNRQSCTCPVKFEKSAFRNFFVKHALTDYLSVAFSKDFKKNSTRIGVQPLCHNKTECVQSLLSGSLNQKNWWLLWRRRNAVFLLLWIVSKVDVLMWQKCEFQKLVEQFYLSENDSVCKDEETTSQIYRVLWDFCCQHLPICQSVAKVRSCLNLPPRQKKSSFYLWQLNPNSFLTIPSKFASFWTKNPFFLPPSAKSRQLLWKGKNQRLIFC